MTTDRVVRQANPDDALAMAELIDLAGEGMPTYLWRKQLEPNESVWDVGQERARRVDGGFSFRNTTIVESAGQVAACMIGYAIAEDPDPVDHEEMPPMFVPLQELENAAPATWYINALATYPQFRGKQHGSNLLSLAERKAIDLRLRGTSLIVADENRAAHRLYSRTGYHEIESRSIVKDDWHTASNNWILMIKEL